jgi:hypothetical protein
MLVRNQDGIQPADIFTDRRQALRDFATAQAGIDQYSRPVRGNKYRVAGAAAG